MKKRGLSVRTGTVTPTFVCIVACVLSFPWLYAQSLPSRPVSPAAISFLEKAVDSLSRSEYELAALQAGMGSSYDPVLADFPYIEALSLVASGSSRAEIIYKLEHALSEGMLWRTYDRAEARVFCARMYAETCRYDDALALLSLAGPRPFADSDYVRALALYGAGRVVEARAVISDALDRWPFDPRFTRLFFLRERDAKPTEKMLALASRIVSRVYLWEDLDREILLLSIPFVHDPAVRERYIRIYRGMGKIDHSETVICPLSSVAALEYGLISEDEALDEILTFSRTGIPLFALESFYRLTGSTNVKKRFKEILNSFEGQITHDANGDGLVDITVSYVMGIPSEILLDSNQDGVPEYRILCDGGLPSRAEASPESSIIIWDQYPYLRAVQKNNCEYTLKPLSLVWSPVHAYHPNVSDPSSSFSFYHADSGVSRLTETVLVQHSVFCLEPDPTHPGGTVRTSFTDGIPVTSESRQGSRVYSWTSFARGVPERTLTDRDGDGYFETLIVYDASTGITRIEIDRNGNRVSEYREEFDASGNKTISWDIDEDGVFEISWSRASNGTEVVSFLHPKNGETVFLDIVDGNPRAVRRGSRTVPVLRDPAVDLWWLGRIPFDARDLGPQILDSVNLNEPTVVSSLYLLDGRSCVIVRSGGKTYVEISDE